MERSGMKLFKRLSASSLIGAALAILFASNVAAAGNTQVSIWDNYCSHSGGAYGHGYVALLVAAGEYGKSGVNQMKFTAVLMYRTKSGAPWVALKKATSSTPYFANTNANRGWTWKPEWDWKAHVPGQERIDVTVTFLDKDPPTGTVATQTVHGRSCSTA
jgi:hypothetical protein